MFLWVLEAAYSITRNTYCFLPYISSHIYPPIYQITQRLPVWVCVFFNICNFIDLFFWLCWVFTAGFSLVAGSGSYSLAVVHELLIKVTSFVPGF